MANNQGPQGNHDPAGSTQMFRAFVDEGGPQSRQAVASSSSSSSSGPRIGLIIGVVAAVAIVAAVAWLALK
ncbi:hypothetical protein [Streptomyces sp. TRM68367]|uniref:hypothetical protein n=1 Tax=Streptomyces sp. TRM68367 TaxID=2758415 RepID=UPI00165B3B11|nr:hypothetical protein [Streptomyces sp. TRM68367]MBC9728058.1 hypothetical protein [Streptomyces sp. TRM68367]